MSWTTQRPSAGGAWSLPARQELKYVIPDSLARRIALFAQTYCDRDASLPPSETVYTITSLYLDSPDLQLYWEKKTLRWERMKVRVRTYGPRSEGPVFAEVKRRYGEVISKTRSMVPRETWKTLVLSPTAFDPALFPKSNVRVLKDFCVQCERYRLRPILSLRYDREPLIGRLDPEIRVTFDRAIRYARVSEPILVEDDVDYTPLTFNAGCYTHEPLVVLELKFNRVFPLWMQQLVERFDLDRGSFSKYMRSIDQMQAELPSYAPTTLGTVLG